VTCLLKAKIAEPEEPAVARQWHYKHDSTATEADPTVEGLSEKKHATTEELLETAVAMQSAPRLYTADRKVTAVSVVSRRVCEWVCRQSVLASCGQIQLGGRQWQGVAATKSQMWDWHQPTRTGAVEHGSREIYSIGSRYQATTGEDTADWEDLVRVVVNCTVYELATELLYL
jgi:hypothetical protein